MHVFLFTKSSLPRCLHSQTDGLPPGDQGHLRGGSRIAPRFGELLAVATPCWPPLTSQPVEQGVGTSQGVPNLAECRTELGGRASTRRLCPQSSNWHVSPRSPRLTQSPVVEPEGASAGAGSPHPNAVGEAMPTRAAAPSGLIASPAGSINTGSGASKLRLRPQHPPPASPPPPTQG